MPVLFQKAGESAPAEQDDKSSENPAGQRSKNRMTAVRTGADSLLEQVKGSESSPKTWDVVFQKQRHSSEVLAEVVLRLHNEKKFDAAVECLLSSVRNDHAQPWTYDVLAIEMKLAGRPVADLERVLQSRIDFTAGDVSQMMLTAAMLSRFESDGDALQICRKAASMAPDRPEVWMLAKSISEQSGTPEDRAWSRMGIIRNVWNDGHENLHREAKQSVVQIIDELNRAGRSETASALREELTEAETVDLRIRLTWTGTADLDLMIEEPAGDVCSYKNRITTQGGRLLNVRSNGPGAGSGRRMEEYVCPIAQSGTYTAVVRFVTGKAAAGGAKLEIIQNQHSAAEQATSRLITLGKEDSRSQIQVTGRGTAVDSKSPQKDE